MNTLKRLLPIAFCLLCLPSAHADLIKQSAAYNRTVLITSTTDHITGATGLTAFTVTLSKAGGTVATITPTVTEIGAGRYSVALVTGNTGTLGALDMTITATGADPTDSHDQVVAFDPSSDLGAAALTGINTKTSLIATNAADSPNAVTAQSAVNTTGTAVTALPANTSTAVWGAATKTVTGGTVTTVTNAVVLPTTPPTGYGGSTGDTPGTTSLLAKIGTPAGASIAADVAAVKSDTGSLVTNVASLPAANATAVWGSTTRALTDKSNFALVSTEYANIAAVTTTYGFDGPPAGTILTLTITRNGSSQPVLTWTADPAATLYKVYRSTDGANYTVIATPATGTLTYTDTARPAGATVYYHITSTH